MSIYDKVDHLDQLSYWWDIAEEGIPKAGDTVIFNERRKGLGFHVTKATVDHSAVYNNARILSRAPKPVWHNAVAVMARRATAPEDHREPFIRSEATPDVWIGEGGYCYSDDLRDVTPLIEAEGS